MRSHRSRGRRGVVGVLLALLLFGVVGCVDVPTSGPIEKISGQEPACDGCVNVDVPPPAPGDSRDTIVENYLRANANYQPNYAVAKQYLTHAAAATWSPDVTDATIYRGSIKIVGKKLVRLTGRQVGYLDKARTFNAQPSALRTDFKLKQEGGEWRIDTPPAGLFVSQKSFTDLYKPYDLFFVGTAGSLVPQSMYLPNLRNPDNVATALVKALLGGPSAWLSPAVSSAVPTGTALDVDAVTVVGGVAQVPLTNQVQQLPEQQATRLAAQLVYTLQQVTGVKKVLVLVDGKPVSLPGSAPGDQAVPVDGIQPGLDPIPPVAAEQLYAVRKGRLGVVSANVDQPEVAPVAGELADGTHQIDSLAVSVAHGTLAAVTDGGTVVREAASDGNKMTTVLSGVTRLLRPQFARNDRLWVAGDRDGRQQMWLVEAQVPIPVPVAALTKGRRLVAFRVSPDGSRLAMVIARGGRTTLGLGQIIRAPTGTTTVTGWRELDVGQTGTATPALRDVAWTDASTLVVLRRDDTTGRFVPVELPDDASQVLPEQPSNGWSGRSLTVLLRTKTPLVVTEDGQVLRDDGTSWVGYLTAVGAVAGPG